MVNEYGRKKSQAVELQATAADHAFASFLRYGQQQLGAAARSRYIGILLALLAVVLLVLGLPASALPVAALGGWLWWLRGRGIIREESR
jgi:hypothetical protein